MFEPGTQIAYIPTHAAGKLNHPDTELGFVMLLSSDPTAVFCRYWRKNHIGQLRTVANSELTPVDRLVKYNSVPQRIVERTIKMILENAK